MKKLIFASILMLASLTACQNDSINPANEDQHINHSKTASRESEFDLEKAIELTKNDETLIMVNEKTLQVVYKGQLLPKTPEEFNEIAIKEADVFVKTGVYPENYTDYAGRKTKTVCSVKNSNGSTTAIVHVYDTNYSGYQIVTYQNGLSASSEISLYSPLDCLLLHIGSFWD